MARKGHPNAANLTGEQFALLTVVERAGNSSTCSALWRCRCECGGEKLVVTRQLRNGSTRSCGCLRQRMWKEKRAGWREYKEYYPWKKMLREATESDGACKVIKKWHMLPDFIADIGPTPGTEYTIGRYDTTQDFRVGNVFWESAQQRQSRGMAGVVAAHANNPLCRVRLC